MKIIIFAIPSVLNHANADDRSGSYRTYADADVASAHDADADADADDRSRSYRTVRTGEWTRRR